MPTVRHVLIDDTPQNSKKHQEDARFIGHASPEAGLGQDRTRRNPPDDHGVIVLTADRLPAEIAAGQSDPPAPAGHRSERAPARRDHHERISGNDISPPGRQREQHAILVVQMDPVLTPVLAVRDELEIPAEQRMEPVRHPHTSVPIIRIGCS